MRPINLIAVICGILACLVWLSDSRAGDFKKWRIGAAGKASFVGGGTAGSIDSDFGSWSPDNEEIFDWGRGFALEAARRIDENWEAVFGAGYASYPGDSSSVRDSANNSISLKPDDLNAAPVYVGFRSLFTSEPDEGLVPYVTGEIGAQWLGEVDAKVQYNISGSAGSFDTTWWDDSFLFMWGIGGGLEYRADNLGAFLAVKSRWTTSPKEGGSIHVLSDNISVDKSASGWQTINAYLGLNYYF